MKINRIVILSTLLTSIAAFAEIGAPLTTAPATEQAGKKLENLLQCKSGTVINSNAVRDQFLALGLKKGKEGYYVPPASTKPMLFNGQVLAAAVHETGGERKVSIYLSNPPVKTLATRLGVTNVDDMANTDEASYIKQPSPKNFLMVGAEAELYIGNDNFKYRSMVACVTH